MPKPGVLFLSLGLAFLASWPLLANIKAIIFNCHSAVDFPIYQQAIYDIWTLKDPNPFVSIKNYKIFNDHFDPALYLAVAFTALFGQGFQQLLVFEWLFFLGLLASIFFLFKRNLKVALPYLLCTLLTKLLLVPLLFPIHPSSWACLPLFWLTYFIVKDKKLPLAITVPLLCLFKESYAFALFPLGFYYAWKREFRLSAGILFSTSVFIAFELIFREKLLGPIYGHGEQIFTSLRESPVSFFKNMLFGFQAIPFGKMFYPFVICFVFYAKSLKNHNKRLPHDRLLAVFLVFMPLFFLRIWHNQIEFHYGAQFAGILLGLMVSLEMFANFSKRTLAIVVALFYFSSMGTYTRMFKRIFLNSFPEKCLVDSSVPMLNQRVKKKMASIPRNKAIVANREIIPFIMLPNKNITCYESFETRKHYYDYLVLEPKRIEKNVLSRCRPLAKKIYIDNDRLFFARGDFENCVYP